MFTHLGMSNITDHASAYWAGLQFPFVGELIISTHVMAFDAAPGGVHDFPLIASAEL
ncbi:MAG: hypothetical protein L0287_06115 [Anaerolineae bacterium]|nr:hypothetical protein [Anaerolineae bacterium]